MNCWNWKEFEKEVDVRILVQVLLDWIETALIEPVISQWETIEFLKEWVNGSDLMFNLNVKANITKVAFRTVEKIVKNLLCPLLGTRDFKTVLTRTVIALLGQKKKGKWADSFNGGKMKKIVFSDSDTSENAFFSILTTWCEKSI